MSDKIVRPMWQLAGWLFRAGAVAHLILASLVMVVMLKGAFLGGSMPLSDRQAMMLISAYCAAWASCCWLIADRIEAKT